MKPKNIWASLLLVIVLSTASGLLTGCSQKGTATDEAGGPAGFAMAPMDDMPAEVKTSAENVKTSYAFAAANPAIMKQLPCYCGCGTMGHRSLYACYVASAEPSGKITYDTHALGCTICVDIAQDAMRMLKDGKTVQQARAYIDQTYSQYGKSNLP